MMPAMSGPLPACPNEPTSFVSWGLRVIYMYIYIYVDIYIDIYIL